MIRQLNYKPTSNCNDVGSHISGATGKSIGTATTGGNSLQSGSSAHEAFRTKDLALQLANANRENAELKSKLSNLDSRIEQLTQLLLNQQVASTPSQSTNTSNVAFSAQNTNNVSFTNVMPSHSSTLAEQQRQQGAPPPQSGSEAPAVFPDSSGVSQGS
jgi:hypothetical protein